MEFINDDDILCEPANLLAKLNELKEDSVIVIDEESAGIFLPKEKIVIIEHQAMYSGPSWERWEWDDYIKDLKEQVDDLNAS